VQVTAGAPGAAIRYCRRNLASVLVEAGDVVTGERVCAETLARSRDVGDQWALAGLLPMMVDLDLQAGRIQDAAVHLRESLQLALRTGMTDSVCDNLDCCGHLCAATGRLAEALTAWAALAALRRQEQIPDLPVDARRRDKPLRRVRRALGPARARAAGERGTAMSLAAAAEYALMLAGPRPAAAGDGRPGTAQRPGTRAGHLGGAGPQRRADRRRAVYQHPHRPLPPGPDRGQDRLPPPRRPDPAGPHRRTGLARPRAARAGPPRRGRPTPPARAGGKGVTLPLPRAPPGGRRCR